MRLIEYIKATKGELKHVSWPTRKQTAQLTVLVIAVSLAVAVFVAAFDVLFTALLEKFIVR